MQRRPQRTLSKVWSKRVCQVRYQFILTSVTTSTDEDVEKLEYSLLLEGL